MKSARQMAILQLIAETPIETQEQLANALTEHGINVTQATVSRDIKELRLVKVMDANGIYRYAAHAKDNSKGVMLDRFARMLSDSLLSIASSMNIVVIHTLSGSASMAAEAIDSMQWPEVIGSLAGDNTIMLIIREDVDAQIVVNRLREYIK